MGDGQRGNRRRRHLRQEIRYASGLTLWVNWRADPWRLQSQLLPQWGFLAIGPETRVTTALFEGHVADYAECPEYFFADARTSAEAAAVQPWKNIQVRLAKFEHLGGDRVRVTYEWIVNDTLDQDYHCFVHGVQRRGNRAEGIVFQQDHALPQPTSRWKVGTRIIDGPYEFSVPAAFDRYDLAIGLFKGQRVALQGCDAEDRVTLARLKLDRSAGKIVSIVAESAPRHLETDPRADFSAHLNPPGTWIDFGHLATDGAVKINRETNRLVLFPYPRNKAFRVSLDLKAISAGVDPAHVKVRALAAGDAHDLGPAEFHWEKGRLMIPMGRAGVGRYAVEFAMPSRE